MPAWDKKMGAAVSKRVENQCDKQSDPSKGEPTPTSTTVGPLQIVYFPL